jgi:hypothetical protein
MKWRRASDTRPAAALLVCLTRRNRRRFLRVLDLMVEGEPFGEEGAGGFDTRTYQSWHLCDEQPPLGALQLSSLSVDTGWKSSCDALPRMGGAAKLDPC